MTFGPSGSLLSPTEIRGVRLENKIVLPAMVTRLSGADGFVNGDIRDRYRIVAYDLAGNRSQPLGPVDIRLGAMRA
ncbi:MAG: hypothetical protein ACYTDU_02630 [Planctomycetota bacterium]|jgi:2,4-dienoyl-CoA reductase-like NADH-dependent reductase (Old Yellow Enzyme family)